MEGINQKGIIFPGIKALKYSQDRYLEKKFISNLKIEPAPYSKEDNLNEFYDALKMQRKYWEKRGILTKNEEFFGYKLG